MQVKELVKWRIASIDHDIMKSGTQATFEDKGTPSDVEIPSRTQTSIDSSSKMKN